jgi:hypothetical protein
MDRYERRRRFWLKVFALMGVLYIFGLLDDVAVLIGVAIILFLLLVMNGIGDGFGD